ncbi:unnamed protein product [Cladocopium goreaui]|uniref:Choline/ethanolaminephosphotransferase 1 n=1 Tax=Cladocopium goreaui TaxID=2562237 RepID=A0A9P1GTI8_9DINO|nr:unnamed protein product [Cladocopium goreaui]
MLLAPRLAPKTPWFRYRRLRRVRHGLRGCASSALVTGQAEAEDAAEAAAEKLATSMTSPSLVLFFAKGYGPRARSMGSIFQERFKDATVLGCNSEGGVIAEGQEQQTQTFGLAALALAGGDESQSSREMFHDGTWKPINVVPPSRLVSHVATRTGAVVATADTCTGAAARESDMAGRPWRSEEKSGSPLSSVPTRALAAYLEAPGYTDPATLNDWWANEAHQQWAWQWDFYLEV